LSEGKIYVLRETGEGISIQLTRKKILTENKHSKKTYKNSLFNFVRLFFSKNII